MIEAYSHDKHLLRLESWLKARGVTIPPLELFSDHGYCVDGIAIGFLFFGRNSTQCWIDHIAADPEAEQIERDNALNTLLKQLETDAKHSGYHLITVLGKLPAMKRRLEGLGYRIHGDYTLYYRVPGEN